MSASRNIHVARLVGCGRRGKVSKDRQKRVVQMSFTERECRIEEDGAG